MGRAVSVVIDQVTKRVPKCEAYPGDQVTWDSGGLDISLVFDDPSVPNTAVGIFEEPKTATFKGTRSVNVSSDAKTGSYNYIVDCKGEHLQGNSHPVMIIKKP